MEQTINRFCVIVALLVVATTVSADPTLKIAENCTEFVPLYQALPANDTFVTSMVTRSSDDLIIGATCGKKQICLFSFNPKDSKVTLLDNFEALWWDEPRVALGPEGDIFLAARRTYDKQYVFERARKRPHTPDTFKPLRDSSPPPGTVNEDAPSMPIRRYSPDGKLIAEIPMPEPLAKDGVGALVVCADGKMLCGLSSPGGVLFTISLASGEAKEYGEVARLPSHHHTRSISKTLMVGDDGKVYLSGQNEDGGDEAAAFILALDPMAGELKKLDVRLPAVIGRRRFAAIDAVVKLPDGSFIGGTTDGYLFSFNPKTQILEGFGKPLRQHNICGLARGSEGLIYGVGGEPLGLPRLFAFDPVKRCMHIGIAPSGRPESEESATFGNIGAVAITSNGTFVCGEKERRSYLLIYRPTK